MAVNGDLTGFGRDGHGVDIRFGADAVEEHPEGIARDQFGKIEFFGRDFFLDGSDFARGQTGPFGGLVKRFFLLKTGDNQTRTVVGGKLRRSWRGCRQLGCFFGSRSGKRLCLFRGQSRFSFAAFSLFALAEAASAAAAALAAVGISFAARNADGSTGAMK